MPRTLTAASNPFHAVHSVPVGLCNRSKVPGMRETGCHVWAGLTKAGTGALGGRGDVRDRQVPTASFGNKPGGMPWVPRDMHHHHASSRSNPERGRRVVVNSLGCPAAVAWPTTKRQSRIGVVAGLALSAFEPDEVEQVQGVGVPPAQLLSWTQTLGGPALAMCQLMETADGTTCKTRVRGDSCCAGNHGTVVRFRSGREQFCVSSNCDFPSALKKWCGLAQVIRGPNRRLFRHP